MLLDPGREPIMRNYIYFIIVFGIIFKVITTEEASVSDLLAQTTCSDKTSVETANQQCLHIYNVGMVIASPQDLTDIIPDVAVYRIGNFILDNSNVICSKPENYTKAVSCLFQINKKCSSQLNPNYPSESTYLENVMKTCDTLTKITTENNHAVEIQSEASCHLGTDHTVLSELIQQCINRNNIGIQLSSSAALAQTTDAINLNIELRNIVQVHNEDICSNLEPFLRAVNCMHYLVYKCSIGASFWTTTPIQIGIQIDFNTTCSVIEQLTQVDTQVAALTDNLDCSVQSAIVEAQQQCFSIYNITLMMADPEKLATIDFSSLVNINKLVFEHTFVICQNQEEYENVRICLHQILFKCDRTNAISIDMFSTMRSIQDLEQTCTFLSQASAICLAAKQEALGRCTTDEGVTVHDAIPCRLQNKIRACEYPLVRKCSELSVIMYENITKIGPVCRNQPDTSVALPDGHIIRVDCSTVKGRQDGYLDCLLYNGIFLDVPIFDTHEETVEHIMKSFAAEMFTDMCRNMSLYQAAITCVLSVDKECPSSSEQNLLPDSVTVTSGMTTLCAMEDKFDNNCVMNADQSMCKWNTRAESTEELCTSTTIYTQCMTDAVQSCNEDTRTLYKNLLATHVRNPCGETGVSTLTNDGGQTTRVTQPTPQNKAAKTVISAMTVLMCTVGYMWSI